MVERLRTVQSHSSTSNPRPVGAIRITNETEKSAYPSPLEGPDDHFYFLRLLQISQFLPRHRLFTRLPSQLTDSTVVCCCRFVFLQSSLMKHRFIVANCVADATRFVGHFAFSTTDSTPFFVFCFFFWFFFFLNLLIDSQIWSDLRQSPAGGAPRQQLPGDGFDLGLVQSSAPCQGTEFFFDLFQYFFFTEFFFCFSPPSITRRFSWQARRSSRFASLFVFLFAWTWTWADDVLPSFTEFYRVFFLRNNQS